ncbi:CDC42 small effector protein 2-like [Sycon ciliatum]|uniref:CDC42 small effector protein 2-like n=1 Tax=Sycon ciliatum TaxID=27933 RepID=UPI0020AD231C
MRPSNNTEGVRRSWFSRFLLPRKKPPPRRKIDRSMIGNPANFQHNSHIGSTDVGSTQIDVQSQMQGKGGYISIAQPAAN